MENLVRTAVNVSLVIHMLLILISVWRVWRGQHAIDRLLAADVISTLLLAVLLLFIMVHPEMRLLIDVTIGLAAVSFTYTILLSRYMSRNRGGIAVPGEGGRS